MTFLQTGIRLSELAAFTLEDVDFENRLLTIRQGKGQKDRQIPLVDDEVKALRNHLRCRATELILDDDTPSSQQAWLVEQTHANLRGPPPGATRFHPVP